MSKNKDKDAILKIPVQLEGFSYRKTTQDWGITFCLQPENLSYGKPLQDFMNHHFVLGLIRVDDKEKIGEIMSLEDIPFEDNDG